MTFRRHHGLALWLALLLAVAPACTDHSYDFDRLNREVTVGGDITLPLGSTGRITVAQMLEDKLAHKLDDLIFRHDDDSYTVEYQAHTLNFSYSPADYIDGANPFRTFVRTPVSAELPLFDKPAVSFTPGSDEADLTGLIPEVLKMPRRSMGHQLTLRTLPKELVGLESLSLSEDSRVQVTVSIPDCVMSEGTITPDLKIDLSSFVEVAEASEGITHFDTPLTPENGYKATRTYSLRKVTIDPEKFNAKEHRMDLDIRVRFEGTFSFDNPATDRSTYSRAAAQQCIEVEVMLLKMECTSIVGRFDFHPSDVSAMMGITPLTSRIRQALEGFDVSYDFDKPEIILEVQSDVSMPTGGLMTLTAVLNDKPIASLRDIPVEFPLSTDGTMRSHRIRVAKGADTAAGDIDLDVSPLLRELPDDVMVTVSPYTLKDKTGEVFLTKRYRASVIPNIIIPISFGPGMQLSFRDTLALPDSLAMQLTSQNMQLFGEITNTLPMQIELDCNLADDYGRPVFEPISAVIKAKGNTPFELPLETLIGRRPEELKEAILNFKFTVPEGGQTVYASDYVQARLQVRLPDGFHTSF